MRSTRSVGLSVFAVWLFIGSKSAPAQEHVSDVEILGKAPAFRVETIATSFAAFFQRGRGYQSPAGPVSGPGLETLTVLEPQVEVVVRQGERVTHDIWVPVDIVTAASASAIDRPPAPPDVVSSASQVNQSVGFEWTTSYHAGRATDWLTRAGFHVEEPFRSWNIGLGTKFSLADDNTVVAIEANEVFDWFDRFDLHGQRHGRVSRNSLNGNLAVTQLLSPTTIGYLSYGITLQEGELGNTWNVVPLDNGTAGLEILPQRRVRHAFVGRVAQWLPWHGAAKAYYRFYGDDWGIVAHSLEGQLLQRLAPFLYAKATYRVHRQTKAAFYTVLAQGDVGTLRTADSDLDSFDSKSYGVQVHVSLPSTSLRETELAIGFERYIRTNDLEVNVVLWNAGFRF